MNITGALSTASSASPWQSANKPNAAAAARYRELNSELKTKAATDPEQAAKSAEEKAELKKAFNSFVGESLFGQMLEQMRRTVGKSAYFHGGQAEELFSGQLDQLLAQKMTESSGHNFSDRLYEQQFERTWTA